MMENDDKVKVTMESDRDSETKETRTGEIHDITPFSRVLAPGAPVLEQVQKGHGGLSKVE